ncbi:hypothetical protein [Neptunomonas concharum]|uniref:DUF7832 domain-containing protein n=1 Tax=Neptunomonas concharum TaxID=1031538 RepID=A0A5P1RAN0_9GAMM|nr:hypothetical protein [Neptunomonas concharum]QEQ96668.1 hypothetical protein F0U83_08035 [Neptunomonas concharum]
MKYDDASWHYGGDFPSDLPIENGAIHIGMFVTWCLLNNLAGSIHTDQFPEALKELKLRKTTPTNWFLNNCDEKFTDEDLNQIGNQFAQKYYDSEDAIFYSDYEAALGNDLETLYHAPDSWETYEKLEPVFQKRFKEWQALEG